MTRDVARLTSSSFDLIVVGGGIHGLFAAYDAAQRGATVALVERGDFGGGLSFNHQRTIHGGLRALQSGDIRKCREMLRERRAWARMAPHLLRPLPFLIGTYRGTRRSRLAVRAGFKVFDWLGRGRNRDVLPELHIPKGRLESAAATRRLFQGLSERRLSGGAIWYDYQTVHPDRLTWCVALAAEAAGAVLCNYVEATGPAQSANGFAGVECRDAVTGATFTIGGSKVILAAGEGTSSLHATFGLPPGPPTVAAMNLLLNRPARDIAVAAASSTGRMYTAVPWQGHVLVGTWQAANVSSGPRRLSEDIDAFLADANSAFPALGATAADVRIVHRGDVPAVLRGGKPDLLANPVITKHASSHVVSVIGAKYTTARLAAERAVNAAGVGRSACRTDRTLLPHADVADSDGMLQETLRRMRKTLDRDVMVHLAGWYGAEGPAVIESGGPTGLERLSTTTPVIAAEIVHAARHSAVVHLTDIVLRRTNLASAGSPGDDALVRAAALAGQELGWDADRRAKELARVRERLTGS